MATAGVDTDTDELDTATAVVDMLADAQDTVARDAPAMVAARGLDLAADVPVELTAAVESAAVVAAT